jgi:predicted HTH domain antitoxin
MGADLRVPEQILSSAKISAEQLLIEVAVYLYDSERLSLGQARALVEMDVISFQKELAKRDINIKFDIKDFEDDLISLDQLRSQDQVK